MTHPSHPERAEPSANNNQSPVRPSHGGGAVTGAVHRPQDTHYDPAGKPVVFTDSSVRDQQAGGDMTGREPETRDDNYINDAADAGLNRQLQRDMGTSIDQFSPVKSARLSSDTPDPVAQPEVRKNPPPKTAPEKP